MPVTGLHKQTPPKMPPPKPVEDDEEKEEKIDPGSLPLISVLDKGTMETARTLLTEAEGLREKVEREEARLKEIKEALVSVCAAFELNGLRWGQIGLVYSGMTARKTLNKKLLLEQGVTAEQIKNAYQTGKEYVNARFIKVTA